MVPIEDGKILGEILSFEGKKLNFELIFYSRMLVSILN